MSGSSRAEVLAAIEFRKAVPPEQVRFAQCRNCKHITYDTSEFMNFRTKKESWRRKNTRCTLHKIPVRAGTVCQSHVFAYADRSDR